MKGRMEKGTDVAISFLTSHADTLTNSYISHIAFCTSVFTRLMEGGAAAQYAHHIRNTGFGWALIEIVAFLGTSGRNYLEILKCGDVFNISSRKSKGVTPLRNNEAMENNNDFAIYFGLKK